MANGKWATSFDELDVALPDTCSKNGLGWMACGNSWYKLSQNGDFVTSAFTSGGVVLIEMGCPQAGGGACGGINMAYDASYSNWVYQHVPGPFCQASCHYVSASKYNDCLEYAHQLCKQLSGREPVADTEYLL